MMMCDLKQRERERETRQNKTRQDKTAIQRQDNRGDFVISQKEEESRSEQLLEKR